MKRFEFNATDGYRTRGELYPQVSVSPQALWKCHNGDPALLSPGIHYLRDSPSPEYNQRFQYTPQAVLSNSVPFYARPTDSFTCRAVEFLERRPEHCGGGRPLLVPPLSLSVNGVPAPYLSGLATGHTIVDGAKEPLFAKPGWSRMDLELDFPGVLSVPSLVIDTVMEDPDERTMTRQEFVTEVASWILAMIRDAKVELRNSTAMKRSIYTQHPAPGQEKLRLEKINPERLRLVAVNFYGKKWVPVLALDVERPL
ncbi:hypothetical protein V5O48_014711 [Marasmius crinis-equi]|uniref:Uncharacterized protein n=1 Tax=Marasmius crinis-equi TaxID=585013 RepID=A0ABR3EWM2_9AGAR